MYESGVSGLARFKKQKLPQEDKVDVASISIDKLQFVCRFKCKFHGLDTESSKGSSDLVGTLTGVLHRSVSWHHEKLIRILCIVY